MSLSPTQLSKFCDNCPAALRFYLDDKQSRDAVMVGEARLTAQSTAELEVEGPAAAEIGIAFHACIHAAALAEKENRPREAAIEATALAMARKYNPHRVREGADMANEFVFWWEFNRSLEYEYGAAFDEKWQRTSWDSPDAMMRLIMDAQGLVTIDDPVVGEAALALGQDYKSGWGASEHDLDSVQGLAYSVALTRMYREEAEGVRVEIISTRLHRTFQRTWLFDNEEQMAELVHRKQKLDFYIKAAQSSDYRPRVGLGCVRCDYTERCGAYQDRMTIQSRQHTLGSRAIADPAAAARDMAICKARGKALEEVLKEIARAKPIVVDGQSLGFTPKKRREPKDTEGLVDLWMQAAGKPESVEDAIAVFRGFVKRISLGVTDVDAVVKAVGKSLGYQTQKEAREALQGRFVEEVLRPEFGWSELGSPDGQGKEP